MSLAEAQCKAQRIEQLIDAIGSVRCAIDRHPHDNPAFWVPGRIEVLGKHTDYGGGRSLLCAIERGICVVAREREADPGMLLKYASLTTVRVHDANSGETVEFELSREVPARVGHWSNYAITVARRIASNFDVPMLGADIVFASDLPPAAGVSSSSALVVAIFLALAEVNRLRETHEWEENIKSPEDLAGYLGAIENGLDFKALRGHVGVGTFGGSEDHTAILCSRPGSLVQYSFCPVTFERAISIPPNYTFVIAASGILAEKTGAALAQYNDVSRRLSSALKHWRRSSGRSDASMGEAVASAPDAPTRIRNVLSVVADGNYSAASLVDRFDQFYTETEEIIPAASDALGRGDFVAFGALVARSQEGAERGLGNQIPETVALVREARALGAVAASAFGAGFGGSVWALVDSPSVETFRRKWSDAYAQAFPEAARRSDFFTTVAGPPAVRL